MTEWFALILLIPVVLVPLVLLFGFAGCTVGEEARLVRLKVFEKPLAEDFDPPARCVVQRIEPARLFNSGTVVRIILQRPTNADLVLNGLYISHAATEGNRYNSAQDPTEVLSEPLVVPKDPGNGLLEVPAVYFPLDKTKTVLLAFDIASSGSVRRSGPVLSEDAAAFFSPLPEASARIRSAGYGSHDRIYLVQRIEVDEWQTL